MVTEVGHYVVHDVNQERDDLLLLIAVEHHVQEMSQHLRNHYSGYQTSFSSVEMTLLGRSLINESRLHKPYYCKHKIVLTLESLTSSAPVSRDTSASAAVKTVQMQQAHIPTTEGRDGQFLI